MICWVPGCDQPEYEWGVCFAHRAEDARVEVMVLCEPHVEREADWNDMALTKRADRERAQAALIRQRAEMQVAKWKLTGKVPKADDTIDLIRRDMGEDMLAGSRNAGLNRAGYRFGRLVAGGALSRSEAESMLVNTAETHGLPRHEAKYVIARSLDAGADNPYLTHG